MLVTVTTTNKKLVDILSTAQKNQIDKENYQCKNILIQNLGAQDIYIEHRADADTSSGLKIAQGEALPIEEVNLEDINLIADSADNTDVRVIIN